MNWLMTVITAKTVDYNNPDMIPLDNKGVRGSIIELEVPLTKRPK
jgi:hypothetical protein